MRETLVDSKILVIYTITLFLMSLFSGTPAIAETTTYHWEKDEVPSGQETVFVPQPIEVEIEGTDIKTSISNTASLRLANWYKVYLSPKWDEDKAYLLLQALQDMSRYASAWRHTPTYWILSDAHVAQDIDLGPDVAVGSGSLRTITIASEAFTYAQPFIAKIDGIQGRYFSKRLWRAALRFATYIPGIGIQHRAIDNMLQYKYGVTVHVPDYEVLTGEPAHKFSQFSYEEILGIMVMFEEYPSGMHVTHGLKYLIRRAPDPFVKYTARANTGAGFIEFTDKAFEDGITHETQRIILHEKAHFLWAYLFDQQLKADWIELGGWSYEDEDERWITTNQTEFVSDYAHGENPNEDMAESIAYYIVTPDKLRSRSPAKYEFIQNRIMHGTRYISIIREDLTFVVYNLYPDYVYPGEVVRVDVTVKGKPEESKRVEIEIETHTENELDYSTGGIVLFKLLDRDLEGDEKGPRNFSIRLRPIDAQGRTSYRQRQSNILRGSAYVPSSYAKGNYTITQVLTYDANWLTRYNSGGFGLKIYINNIYEDSYPPEYVPNSAKLSVSDAYTEKNEHFYIVTATWQVKEDRALSGSTYIRPKEEQDLSPGYYYYLPPYHYSSEWYSRNIVHADIVRREGDIWTLKSTFYFPHYMPGGVYELKNLFFKDAINRESTWLPNIDDQIQKVTIETKNPDTTPPTLDVNRITVDAEPVNPVNPNGETFVTVEYYVKDDISGFEKGHIAIRDPLGGERSYDIWGPYPYSGTKEIYFQDDPTVYRKYTRSIYLPEGSFPGVWGVIGIGVTDKAKNTIYHDFTEITRFEVTETQAAPTVQVTLPDKNALLANYPNPFNPETWIPYQLAKPADITLTIYAADGQLVRKLAIGHKTAGTYQSRSRAAHWDGKNVQGEPVASGVYFYTLTAGEFSATRKMLIRK